MTLTLEPAQLADAAALAALRNAVAADLTARFGRGRWSLRSTVEGAQRDIRDSSVFVVRDDSALVATLRLATRKPWAIDLRYFTPVERPLYLHSMAVAPHRQRQGLGRRCIEATVEIAARWLAPAIFLDAFDHLAGAGEFYRRCGFREVGRTTYRTVPLIYFERLI